jgi:hypothetical protein
MAFCGERKEKQGGEAQGLEAKEYKVGVKSDNCPLLYPRTFKVPDKPCLSIVDLSPAACMVPLLFSNKTSHIPPSNKQNPAQESCHHRLSTLAPFISLSLSLCSFLFCLSSPKGTQPNHFWSATPCVTLVPLMSRLPVDRYKTQQTWKLQTCFGLFLILCFSLFNARCTCTYVRKYL